MAELFAVLTLDHKALDLNPTGGRMQLTEGWNQVVHPSCPIRSYGACPYNIVKPNDSVSDMGRPWLDHTNIQATYCPHMFQRYIFTRLSKMIVMRCWNIFMENVEYPLITGDMMGNQQMTVQSSLVAFLHLHLFVIITYWAVFWW